MVCNWQDHAFPSRVAQDLHRTMVIVVGRGFVNSPRQGKVMNQDEDPSRDSHKELQEMEIDTGLPHRSNIHPGNKD